jgi:hypothetical protein
MISRINYFKLATQKLSSVFLSAPGGGIREVYPHSHGSASRSLQEAGLPRARGVGPKIRKRGAGRGCKAYERCPEIDLQQVGLT